MPFPESTPQDYEMKRLAMMLALHGVRNTIVEEYHAQGKLSDAEMKVFNIEVVNNLYSLLQLFTNPAYEEARKTASPLLHSPDGWDAPVFDSSLRRAIERLAGAK